MRIYGAREMAEADRLAIEEFGIIGRVLMENAGVQTVNAMEDRYGLGLYGEDSAVLVLCGRGNNGGDGLVVGRHLLSRGTGRLDLVLLARRQDLKGDAAANCGIFLKMGGRLLEAPGSDLEGLIAEGRLLPLDRYQVIVDALFGTGLTSAVRGPFARVIGEINASGRPVVAVDLPSGLSADTPALLGEAVRADLTVALAAPKYPHLLPPADELAGEVTVVDIGIPEAALARAGGGPFVVTEEDAAALLPGPRRPEAHKGDFGHLLVVGGSLGKTGAVALAAEAAYRSGAGLVTVATPERCLPIVASRCSELMTEPLAQTAAGTLAPRALERAVELASSRDVVALGPGISANPSAARFVRGLYRAKALSAVPLVVDADGLNAFRGRTQELDARRRAAPVILTPHPGEMARLLEIPVAELLGHRLGPPAEFARRLGVWVVLKGYRSLTFTPEGEVWVNLTGNPGMATGGSGDVLSGVIAALLGRGMDATDAAILGAHLHGLAGDLAAAETGEESLIAGDLIAWIPEAFRVCAGAQQED